MAAPTELPAETIRRALGGDDGAFAELVRLHRPRLLRVSAGILGDRSEAEDAVQNVFVRFFRYGAGFDPERSLSAYLYRIAVLECYRRLEARRNRPPLEEHDMVAAGWHRPAPDTDRVLIEREKLETVRLVLDRLTERERVCFVLREIEGLGAPEVAEMLGLSPVTVRRFHGIARSKIARALAERFDRPERLAGEGEKR